MNKLQVELLLDEAKALNERLSQKIASFMDEVPIKSISKLDIIIEVVTGYYGITFEQMQSKSRERPLVVARQVCMYFIIEYTTMTLKRIGTLFGSRDHTTVIHARQQVNNLKDTNKSFAWDIQEIRRMIAHRFYNEIN